jgi:hypothetical protein
MDPFLNEETASGALETAMTACSTTDELLLEGSAQSLAAAEAHALDCAACAESLAAWKEISETAQTMRAEWQSDLLWPRIERRLKRQRRAPAALWQIAAAVVLIVGIGAATWYGVRVRAEQAAFDHMILRDAALEEADRAESAHVAAIERLEKVAAPRLHADESPLMTNYREKLLVLDDAIAECQANIERNRQNAHLRRQLLTIYSEKQQTLQDIVREDSHGTTQ